MQCKKSTRHSKTKEKKMFLQFREQYREHIAVTSTEVIFLFVYRMCTHSIVFQFRNHYFSIVGACSVHVSFFRSFEPYFRDYINAFWVEKNDCGLRVICSVSYVVIWSLAVIFQYFSTIVHQWQWCIMRRFFFLQKTSCTRPSTLFEAFRHRTQVIEQYKIKLHIDYRTWHFQWTVACL